MDSQTRQRIGIRCILHGLCDGDSVHKSANARGEDALPLHRHAAFPMDRPDCGGAGDARRRVACPHHRAARMGGLPFPSAAVHAAHNLVIFLHLFATIELLDRVFSVVDTCSSPWAGFSCLSRGAADGPGSGRRQACRSVRPSARRSLTGRSSPSRLPCWRSSSAGAGSTPWLLSSPRTCWAHRRRRWGRTSWAWSAP